MACRRRTASSPPVDDLAGDPVFRILDLAEIPAILVHEDRDDGGGALLQDDADIVGGVRRQIAGLVGDGRMEPDVAWQARVMKLAAQDAEHLAGVRRVCQFALVDVASSRAISRAVDMVRFFGSARIQTQRNRSPVVMRRRVCV